ncbi:serine hydrolase domain-containing protein [Streptomyces endophyticus]|uniref:Beta-lactamase family protein n=1 Tax=Streptomyces endophyticus TaxID=714166 RepID=A0ABU6F9Q2_9ACTN|nr:serine hydrolase [Streptomyces endophyticus]MEB8340766.1 beta-lactamase family protein [Streptomyces endophyticus]
MTAATWLHGQNIGWSFQHLEEIFPVATVSRGGGTVADLPCAPVDVADVEVPLGDGAASSVAEVIASTDTDAWLVLHQGRIVAEEYTGAMGPATRHLLMSVSKSVVATVVGALVDRGVLDLASRVGDQVPELASSGYADARVRDLLDMRSGVGFNEDYVDPRSDIRQLDIAAGWAPRRHEDDARTLKAFLATLRQERPHGGSFAYRSAETDVLGWVCEAAAGRSFPELASELLWSRLGAEHDAVIAVDDEGTGLFDGGICATPRDLARFGATILAGGVTPRGERVLSEAWVEDVFRGGQDSAEAFASGADDRGMPGGHYRSKFWVPGTTSGLALCLGIHGQFVWIDRDRDVVGVKLSSWPDPLDETKHHATTRMFDAVATHLCDRARP